MLQACGGLTMWIYDVFMIITVVWLGLNGVSNVKAD